MAAASYRSIAVLQRHKNITPAALCCSAAAAPLAAPSPSARRALAARVAPPLRMAPRSRSSTFIATAAWRRCAAFRAVLRVFGARRRAQHVLRIGSGAAA
jgi:hypothetical protein